MMTVSSCVGAFTFIKICAPNAQSTVAAVALISLGAGGLWMLNREYTSGCRRIQGRLWKDQLAALDTDLDDPK